MKYTYFVSYSHNRGFGCMEIKTSEEISQWEHILSIGETVSKKIGSESVVVMNYQLMRKE